MKSLQRSFDQIILSCTVNKAVASIRLKLEKEIDKDDDGPTNIELNHISELL
jgi:hypothetical protein